MSGKFSLQAAPKFKQKVDIPVHGAAAAVVEFEFKHRTKEQMNEWLESIKGKPDSEVLAGCVTDWDLDDPCEQKSFELLTENYAGAASVIVSVYVSELLQAREKN